MMVDCDIPSTNQSNPTNTTELLHWMQPGLVSSPSPITVAGQTVYQLINPNNVSLFATYIQPTPPFKIPFSHQYVELLLDTTNMMMGNERALMGFEMMRIGFDAVGVVKAAGVNVVAGNWFNVTNAQALAGGNVTAATTSTSAPAVVTTSGARKVVARWGIMVVWGVSVVGWAGLL
jgi:hypothetical protein